MIEARITYGPRPIALDWDAERVLEAFAILASQGVLVLMWLLTIYEISMMIALPVLFPAIKTGHFDVGVVQSLYLYASNSHLFVFPVVVLFLAYDGFDMLAGRESDA